MFVQKALETERPINDTDVPRRTLSTKSNLKLVFCSLISVLWSTKIMVSSWQLNDRQRNQSKKHRKKPNEQQKKNLERTWFLFFSLLHFCSPSFRIILENLLNALILSHKILSLFSRNLNDISTSRPGSSCMLSFPGKIKCYKWTKTCSFLVNTGWLGIKTYHWPFWVSLVVAQCHEERQKQCNFFLQDWTATHLDWKENTH